MSEPNLKDTVLAGVPLRQYVAVYAAAGEGFPLETVLEHEGLDPVAWGRIDKVWADALVQSADTDLELIEAHDSLLLEAQDRFWRPAPPVSDELEPWLDFFRRVTSNDDPLTLLASMKMRMTDLMRLHRHWSDRIALEPALQKEALRILGQEPGPLPVVSPESVKLPPPVGGGGSGGAPKAGKPEVDGPSEPRAESPALLVPLPPPPDEVEPPRRARPAGPPRSIAPPSRSEPDAPMSFARISAPPPQEQGAKLGLISYASAFAEASVHPHRAVAAWAKYGLAGQAIEAEHRAWRAQFEKYPEERAEFDLHFAQFEGHWRTQRT